MATIDITKATHRRRLAARREPYWRSLGTGRALGVRIGATGESWIARRRHPDTGRYEYHAVPEADDYDQAERLARTWFEGADAGVVAGATVRDAVEDYIKAIRTEKGETQAKDAEGRLRRRVLADPISKIRLADLRPLHVERWRNGLLEHMNKESAGRELRAFKAALNRAYASGVVESNIAWRSVKKFPGAATARTVYLTLEQRRRLVACGHALGAIGNLIEALGHTAARPIEIRRATVADLATSTQELRLSGYKGRHGEVRVRDVPLSAAGFAFFKRMAKGKLPGAPLVARDDGTAWAHSDHDKLFRAARDAAGLPGNVVAYALRHSVLTDWLRGGLDPITVARIGGTSIEMLERHYGKVLREEVSRALARIEVL